MRMRKADPRNWDGTRWGEVVCDFLLIGVSTAIVTHNPLWGLIFSSIVLVLQTVRDIIFDNVREWRRKKAQASHTS